VQQLLLERLGGSSIEYTARVTESVLARLHFVVRPPVARGGRPTLPEVDVPALQDALTAVVRSWTDELADAAQPTGTAPTPSGCSPGWPTPFRPPTSPTSARSRPWPTSSGSRG
jgi:NAD-specific glutamate dehydrogenase